jgi:hypothetical protein
MCDDPVGPRGLCASGDWAISLEVTCPAANDCKHRMADVCPGNRERLRLGFLICVHIVVCCISLISAAHYKFPVALDPAAFHIFFDPSRLYVAVIVAAAFALVSALFAFARFSIGYFVGLYFYTMILGYLWLNCFTDLQYDHRLAGFSAAVSAVAFLLPALFISSPIRQVFVLSTAGFDRLLTLIVLLASTTVVLGAAYNFHLVGFDDMYAFREKIESPTILNYLIGMTYSTLLPFAFAGFVVRKTYWGAGAVLFLLLFFYPITLTKIALLTPFWLVAVWLLSRVTEARAAAVLSLLIPILAGLLLLTMFRSHAALFFSIVNLRIGAVPSVAMDVYNDFFSRHELTYFCQISFLKSVIYCPYGEQLSVVMEKAYKLGNFNASLFATEGIASVGTWFAPVSVLICGLVVAVGNRLSAGLPPRFIMLSGAIIPHALLNVPLSTVLLTHGAAPLFLLWYITPRHIFGAESGEQSAAAG